MTHSPEIRTWPRRVVRAGSVVAEGGAYLGEGRPAAVRRTAAGGSRSVVTADADSCDLAQHETVLRIARGTSVADPGGVRTELVRLARLAKR